jgi:hypothetical protein
MYIALGHRDLLHALIYSPVFDTKIKENYAKINEFWVLNDLIRLVLIIILDRIRI